MLINLTNHPSSKWTEEQLKEARELFDTVVDLPFPNIPPEASTSEVITIVIDYLKKIVELLKNSNDSNDAVHVMGEMVFVYHLVSLLKRHNIPAVASTTERVVEEENGVKVSKFKFVRFRDY